MPNARPIYNKLIIDEFYDEYELRRYEKRRLKNRFTAKNWLFHYLGSFRIVYDVKLKSWTIATVRWSPTTWIIAGLLLPVALLWFGLESLKDDGAGDFPPSVYDKLDDGRERFLPYNAAPHTRPERS